ncbi:uncharacterized protein LOC129722586 [Wyeomyia smithii]|uniref:uncharacterized protein LOC129722586 n=1 Tax=Wyeomyia smithii TaxID=174621 RepID=UPI0024681AE8|nr:uncharacterized protein LOC129722586 [Wyeomyia smithii]
MRSSLYITELLRPQLRKCTPITTASASSGLIAPKCDQTVCPNAADISPRIAGIRIVGIFVESKASCLMRCIMIREGLYDDVRGPNNDRLYVQCGGYGTSEEDFKRDSQQCVNRLRTTCTDNCTLLARITKECYPPGSGLLGTLTGLFG